ncbi:MAG: hypothetical protein K2L98_02640 [Bacilli bacterium]|nr:hypothetical protein [Bacilli bacterium]
MLDEIQERLEKILNECSEEDREKYLLIKLIISNDEWYNKVDVDDVISILVDLNYTKEEAKDIYMQLKGIN